jgi:hypothetical protein
MSESTEELATVVQGLGEGLAEAGGLAEQLGEQATQLGEEAGAHGWHGIAGRMREAAEALEAVLGALGSGQQSCEGAGQELMLIDDKIPADEVVGHLDTSSSRLGAAVIEVEGALEKVEEAQAAVTEVGQEGMMQGTLDLYDQVSELHERLLEQQGISTREQAEAEAYAKRQLGN